MVVLNAQTTHEALRLQSERSYVIKDGEILLKGVRVKFNSPKDAMKLGIGMVHQELMLIPNMSVLENLSLTLDLDYRRLALDLGTIKEKLVQMEEMYGLPVEPEAKME